MEKSDTSKLVSCNKPPEHEDLIPLEPHPIRPGHKRATHLGGLMNRTVSNPWHYESTEEDE